VCGLFLFRELTENGIEMYNMVRRGNGGEASGLIQYYLYYMLIESTKENKGVFLC